MFICGFKRKNSFILENLRQEESLKFEWNDQDVTETERAEIQDFLERVKELGVENAFFDEEALVFIDGTHVPIPEKIRVIRD